ncbi:hypothetical protein GIB67_002312 [Kingdonia uniflora]|uniref:RNase H type-1 domain-containing protein n=1 Tax=Kingdonia uniflora TaxID=39325 RepID=A0A7J7KX24_9MAGN|nr:hypothetical protein GIB67_002312 [Kingdonia uniflora]
MLTSRCSLCLCNFETLDHLLWQCPLSKQIWNWLGSLFQIPTGFSMLKHTLDWCSHLSAYLSDLWKVAALNFIYFLWRARNASVFEGIPVRTNDLKVQISSAVKDAAGLSVNCMSNNCLELEIVADLGVPAKARPLPRVRSCTWALPWFQEVKINVGAVAIGSPGSAGIGAVARNNREDVIGVLSIGLGITTRLFSECEAVIGALYWAAQQNWNKIWIEADFQTITDFGKNHVPWTHRARWNKIKFSLEGLRFTHCLKEANFSASQAAKRGSYPSAEAELEEHARATANSMATLCGTDHEEAGRRMNKTIHQQSDACAQAFIKAQKVITRHLKEAVDNLELARGIEASLVLQAKLAEKDKAMKELRETFQGKFDEECEITVRLKSFIDALGYDPETLQRFSLTNDHIVEDAVRTEWLKVDVVCAAIGGGVEEAVVRTVTDEVVDAAVSNPSTEGTRGVGVEESVGGDGVATPI